MENRILSGMQENQPISPSVPTKWLETYADANGYSPQAPASVDAISGNAMLSTIVEGETNWKDAHESKLTESQLDYLGERLSVLHLAYGIPVVVEGYQPNATQIADARKQLLAFLNIHGRPLETENYKVDGDLAYIPRRVVANAFYGVKNNLFRTSSHFAEAVITGKNVHNPREPFHPITEYDLSVLNHFSSNEEYTPYVQMLARLYHAANNALYSEEARPFVVQQRKEFNLRKEGSPHVRTTDSLRSLVYLVENSVSQAWNNMEYEGIFQDSSIKEQFLDDLTQRKNFS